MRAMILKSQAPIEQRPLVAADVARPEPGDGEVLIRVRACGVCRTDLHTVEGDLPLHRSPVIPGHQVVGTVESCGRGVSGVEVGRRVGVAWLHDTCGRCGCCTTGRENLCRDARFTGLDFDGGYAEFTTARADFVYALPDAFPDEQAAPLLCSGIIGYRALRRSGVRPGGRLGIYGFGASAHVTIQVARFWGCSVYVSTRGEVHRQLARDLGAAWVGDESAQPPVRLDGAILFAPAGNLVLPAMEALEDGAALAVAGIYLSDIPAMNYEKHLFRERTLTSVTANTRQDGRELLALAAQIPIRTEVSLFPLAQANEALAMVKNSTMRGSGVLKIT
jgi:alcohol dehydrogenase, propanol-preferring